MHPDGPLKVLHVDQLNLDLCHQDRANWIRNQLARNVDDMVVIVGTDTIRPQQTTVGVNIACQTSDTDRIIVSNDKVATTIVVCRSSRRKQKPHHLVYYLQI